MLGVVLAGGISQRLGQDKTELTFQGEPLWQRQLTVLRVAGAAATVMVRRPGQPAPPGIDCWRDEAVDAGPMGGLHAALAPQTFPLVAVLAVDMPGIDAAWFHWLRGFCRPGIGAMVQHSEICEPLAAIYPREAIGEINVRLEKRDHSLQRLARALTEIGQMTLIPLPAEKLAQTRGINTPADLDFWTASGK
jgi:molybdopterin-guanine dinucleotide biosynthesis protein A